MLKTIAALIALALAAPVAAQTTVIQGRSPTDRTTPIKTNEAGALLTAPVTGPLVDGSGTVATGGSSQQVFAGNPARAYLFCQNPMLATEPLFVKIGAPASAVSASYELAPGGSLNFIGNFVPGGSVNVTAPTTGHRFICFQG